MSEGLSGDWGKVQKILNGMGPNVKAAKALGLRRAAIQAQSDFKEGMRSGSPGGQTYRPLSGFSVEARTEAVQSKKTKKAIASPGGAKPLINHGDLWNSITHAIVGEDEAFAGVLRSSRSKDGTSMANIAAVHEFGCLIAVTPKMRGWFRYRGHPLKRSTTYIRIPMRPTFGPVVEAKAEEWMKIFADTVRERLLEG